MRLVRANAGKYGIDPARVGFMGFSAGGHVACSIATRFAARVYAPLDAADSMDARPSFSVPMYPVVTMGEGCHKGSRDNLLGSNPSPALIDAYSCERHIPADAPPSWICLAADDTTVPPIENGVTYFSALRRANIPAAIHVFDAGGHGFGIARTAGKPDAVWPELMLRWGASHGFFKSVG
jgi:acetyl esterase/lipase